ncbi:MAG TPA: hypothetical protein VGB91_07255 [Rhizomicrobium sp.]
MRRIVIAASVLWLGAAPAAAGDEVMSGYYGNTVVSTGGMAEARTHYRADHSFDLVGSMMGMSRSYKGTWEIKGGQLCRTYVGDQPPGLPGNPFCTSWGPHKVGDSWTFTASGQSRALTLKSGID